VKLNKQGVVNGDTGVIEAIYVTKDGDGVTHRMIYVRYDDHYIVYDNEYEELALAYALTVHKSQGSQWPTVVCPMAQPTFLLNRKMLYTMYTRAQQTNIVIGRRDLLQRAVHNNQEDKRITLLQMRLRGRCA
jgi:exodeoxyribonuclease V alpha subunit